MCTIVQSLVGAKEGTLKEMNFKKVSLLVLFMSVLIIAACGKTEETSSEDKSDKGEVETVTYENSYELSLGTERDSDTEAVKETVELPKNSDKVLVMDLGVASTFAALGLEDKIIGLPKGDGNSVLGEELENFKDEKFANLGGLKEPDFEQVAMLDPEVIMISGRQANSDTIDELKKAAPNAKIVYVAANPNTYFEDVKKMTTFLGEMYDKQDEAKKLVEDFDNKVEEIHSEVEASDKTMMFIQTNGGDLSLHGPQGRYDFLYSALGFKSAGEIPNEKEQKQASSSHGNQVSYEYVAKNNPGIILVMDRGAAISDGKDATKTDVIKTEVTKNVDAVKNDAIYELDSVTWYLNSGGYKTAMSQLEEIHTIVQESK